MCGICGKMNFDWEAPINPELISRMMGTITHRGPDGEGKYVSGPVGLGHRRLAIIDLNSGAQPMCNEDETVWIVYNGEIYNFQALTEELQKRGHRFRTLSDTEAIIHAYEEYGVECLKHLQGMFAFALWDAKKRTLFLARDRVGIKPLYYCNTGKSLVFGSEIKSLLVDPEVPRKINPAAIDRFLTYLYLPGSETLFADIAKLEPGHYLLVRDGQVICKRYWDLEFAPQDSWKNLDEAADALWQLLKETVRGYMISDVPVGFLLSGGVDSTALLSCAVDETDKQISTFTIGFDGQQFADERVYARLAAERFGTSHHEISISATDFVEFLPNYVWHMEEPVCEPPAIALYYVSKLASEHVKVVLSGEGGDEAFGGYQNYRNLSLIERGKRMLGPLSGGARPAWNALSKLPGLGWMHKYTPLMAVDLPDYYYSRVSNPFSYFNRGKSELYTDGFGAVVRSGNGHIPTADLFSAVADQGPLNQMLYVDTKTWLPDDLLVKADKITMANSLELRVPLLDHLVLEFAAKLPLSYKVRGFETKRVLKRAFERRIPQEIVHRKKTGFPVPYESWLRTDLAGYVRELLQHSRMVEEGYFTRTGVEAVLDRFHEGESLAKEVFSLMTLELWHTEFVDRVPVQAAA